MQKIIFENSDDEKWYSKYPNDFILVDDKSNPEEIKIAVKKGESQKLTNQKLSIEIKGTKHLDPIHRQNA